MSIITPHVIDQFMHEMELWDRDRSRHAYDDGGFEFYRVSELVSPTAIAAYDHAVPGALSPYHATPRHTGTAVHGLVAEFVAEWGRYLRASTGLIFEPGEPMMRELSLPLPATIAGTPDLLAIDPKGRVAVLDLKTQRMSGEPDPGWRYQLSAYNWLSGGDYKEAYILHWWRDFYLHAKLGARPKVLAEVEFTEIPLLSLAETEEWLKMRIVERRAFDISHPHAGCPPNRRWGKLTVGPDGVGTVEDPQRCIYHCRHAPHCRLWQAENEGKNPIPGQIDRWYK
jgi:hypothetical protein